MRKLNFVNDSSRQVDRTHIDVVFFCFHRDIQVLTSEFFAIYTVAKFALVVVQYCSNKHMYSNSLFE